ncbi:hypothetical protein BgiMline_007612 [Biomphalaria glabrata]|nr:hypothetical protein BgiMline_023168 [Biomphalaria glabrata]KAI8788293.1 hypothetical protein BgiBS90_010961 [Biomphalaria glabrata]
MTPKDGVLCAHVDEVYVFKYHCTCGLHHTSTSNGAVKCVRCECFQQDVLIMRGMHCHMGALVYVREREMERVDTKLDMHTFPENRRVTERERDRERVEERERQGESVRDRERV